ncbi:MAG TPA: coenzyme F420-0:L-glutamate ligase [Verrucomicrobiae bacterium]|nr:coenzyme F420-0:L-glutamate ligase [Verrucomicrobiae bacterium]
MRIQSIKTRRLNPPKDDLLGVIFNSIKNIPENSILAVTSKVVSYWQGQVIPVSKFPKRDDLIKQEAERYLDRKLVPHRHAILTIKNNLLIPSAGVDKNKKKGYYILWPKKPNDAAKKIAEALRKHYEIKNVGVLITDSHSLPLRRGVLGISLGHSGFKPIKDYRYLNKEQRIARGITQSNLADGLAAAAVAVMGEGFERTPLALITDIPFVEFTIEFKPGKKPYSSFEVPENEDLYLPLLKSVPWKKGGSKKA